MKNKHIAVISIVIIVALVLGAVYLLSQSKASPTLDENGEEIATTSTTVGTSPKPPVSTVPTAPTSSFKGFYSHGTGDYSIRFPQTVGAAPGVNYRIDENYFYKPDSLHKILGVKFTIPAVMAEGTNLSKDTYFTLESFPESVTCSAQAFFKQKVTETTLKDGAFTYSVATVSEAGAGNRYEETVYAIPGTKPCLAMRYFIHSTAIENYPAGTIKEFDKQAVINAFDAIRHTLVLN